MTEALDICCCIIYYYPQWHVPSALARCCFLSPPAQVQSVSVSLACLPAQGLTGLSTTYIRQQSFYLRDIENKTYWSVKTFGPEHTYPSRFFPKRTSFPLPAGRQLYFGGHPLDIMNV